MHVLEVENICTNYKNLLKEQRFDLIAIEFGLTISKIVPFIEKASYDNILIGPRPKGLPNAGFLGQKVFESIENKLEYSNLNDIIALLKTEEIKQQLQKIFSYSQKYLIEPMLKCILEKSDTIHQAAMNRYLNLDKLDNNGVSDQKDYITKELYSRLQDQGFVQRVHAWGDRAIYKAINLDL